MVFWQRVAIFLGILFAGLYLGWEYALAGIIFSLSLGPKKYEYLLAGLVFDALFLFPRGFFIILILILALAAELLADTLQQGGFSSFSARFFLLTAISGIILGGLFAVSLWPDLPGAAWLTAIYFGKSFAALAVLILLYKSLGYEFIQKRAKDELRFFGAR